MQRRLVFVISETAVLATSVGIFFLEKKAFCQTRLSIKKSAWELEVLIAINNERTIKQSVNCDNYKLFNKIKQATAFSTNILYFIATKSDLTCVSKKFCLMLFNKLYFFSLHVGQVRPKNNLPEAISACLGPAGKG